MDPARTLIWTTAKGGDVTLTYGNSPEKLLRATAFHEAGHAVVGYRFGKWIRDAGVSVDRDLLGCGHTAIRGEFLFPLSQIADQRLADLVVKRLRAECMQLLAGYAAEAREMRVRGLLGGGDDWAKAMQLVRTVNESDDDPAELFLLVNVLPATRRLLREGAVWRTVVVLAKALIAQGTLTGEAADELLERSEVCPVRHTYWL